MHTLHYVAVKLDTEFDGSNADELREEAVSEVETTLTGDERSYSDWYDWFIVGGGRFVEGDAYSNSTHPVILYGDNKDEFLAKLNEALGWQLDEVKRLHEQVSKDFDLDHEVAIYERTYNNSTTVEGHSSMTAWRMRRLAGMLDGNWNPDSHFLDITNGLPSPRYFLKEVEENPNEAKFWALVPVDFHF